VDSLALDVACGTGRLLLPYLSAGLDVDGCDVSADMIAACREKAERAHLSPNLYLQPMHELDLPRHYRTIFVCGALGLGSTRAQDEEALRRFRAHLEAGGTLLVDIEMPYADAGQWPLWTKEARAALPQEPQAPERGRPAPDGADYGLRSRYVGFDPLEQRVSLEMTARRWRDGSLDAEETHRLDIGLYFKNEMLRMLERAGFDRVRVLYGAHGRQCRLFVPRVHLGKDVSGRNGVATLHPTDDADRMIHRIVLRAAPRAELERCLTEGERAGTNDDAVCATRSRTTGASGEPKGRDRRPARGSSARRQSWRIHPLRVFGEARFFVEIDSEIGECEEPRARVEDELGEVRRPLTVDRLDRLADLERVPDRPAERLVHVGEETDDLSSFAVPEIDHLLREDPRIAGCVTIRRAKARMTKTTSTSPTNAHRHEA
jgi:SAM-dependent methyltransferase